jgi:predicted  nucleic acid-binding Zn-ribbon protein
MKVLLLVLFSFSFALAQKQNTQEIDSLDRSFVLAIDSLGKKPLQIESKLDSLNPQHKLDRYGAKLDSLNNQSQLNAYTSKLDSLHQSTKSKIDSLTHLSFLDSATSKKLSHLKNRLDSITNVKPPESVQRAKRKVEVAGNQVKARKDSIENKVNQKLGLFSKNGGNAPGAVHVPGVNLKNSLAKDLKAPGVELPVDKLKTVAEPLDKLKTSVPDVSTDLGGLEKIAEDKLPGTPKLDGISDLKDKLEPAKEIGNDVKAYQGDIGKLKQGDLRSVEKLPEGIENKVGETNQLAAFKNETKGFEAMKKNLSNPDAAKEEALNKAKQTAVNYFAGHDQELKTAIQQMSKLKAKIPNPEGTIDLFKKHQHFLKDKPFVERLVPGFSLQFQKQKSFWLDINPYVGFKISGRFTGGTGWNERFAYNFDKWKWDSRYNIYGLRNFVQFKVKDMLSLKAEAEIMNAPVKPISFNGGSDLIGRAWIWSYFAGMKKDFQFSKHFKGNVQTLYNIYNPHNKSPYTNRLNIRMGFEIPISKKKKGLEEPPVQ